MYEHSVFFQQDSEYGFTAAQAPPTKPADEQDRLEITTTDQTGAAAHCFSTDRLALVSSPGSPGSPDQAVGHWTVNVSGSPSSTGASAASSPKAPEPQRPVSDGSPLVNSPSGRTSTSSARPEGSPGSAVSGADAGVTFCAEVRTAGTGSSAGYAERIAGTGPIRSRPLVPDDMVKDSKGEAVPRALAIQQKSQLRAAPTGGSDSETDNDDKVSDTDKALNHRKTVEEDAEEERKFVDEFGFVIDEDEKREDEKFIRGVDGKQVARREIKWANMAADWDHTNTSMHAKLKERCRKGIPTRLRAVAWQLLVGSHAQMASPENDGVYAALRNKKLRDKEVDEVLGRDLTRTFPNHILFKEEGGIGQTFLRNVLHAYAGCDPEVGYVQGMAFIIGAVSTQMGEEESFWMLHELMFNERYKMRELYKPGFPLLHQFFYQLKRLIARLLPKLNKRFEELEIEPSFYASQWFMTLFVADFSFRALLRIWDIFFSEGWKIIFRTGIALMKWEEKRLLSLPFDELLPALKSLQEGKDAKELVQRAHRVKFKTVELNRYGDEYWQKMGTKLVP